MTAEWFTCVPLHFSLPRFCVRKRPTAAPRGAAKDLRGPESAWGAEQEHYNDDANYKVAYEEVTDLKSLAASVLDLWASEYKPWDAWSLCSISLHVRPLPSSSSSSFHASFLSLVLRGPGSKISGGDRETEPGRGQEARQSLAEQMAKELAEVKCAGPADEARVRALAGKLARLRKFFARDLEAPDPEVPPLLLTPVSSHSLQQSSSRTRDQPRVQWLAVLASAPGAFKNGVWRHVRAV